MKTLAAVILSCALVAATAAQQSSPTPQQRQYPAGLPTRPVPLPPQVHWGRCQQLKPSEQEKAAKQQVLQHCIQRYPPNFKDPRNVTRQEVEEHRTSITACALETEGWFDVSGKYDYQKAKDEIISKNLESEAEKQILQLHESCKAEAKQAFANSIIQQVQLYQNCMEFYITRVCGIQLIPPTIIFGPPPQRPQQSKGSSSQSY
ncbi:uncharacterized protein LOC143224132 [Tachypleus tridentatus]|uniref:uncharacterized protein LOC143224132 n=1 Tax=Tachypleus tridentatus TaxID=6853 RepID=UPI003FD13C8D